MDERLLRISGGRTRLRPVTKAFGPEAVLAVLAAGHRAVGENYAQELLAKHEAIGDRSVEWHMIGTVQRNKVRRLVGPVAVWQTIDRPSLVSEVARRSPGGRILVQVDCLGVPGRGGCPPDEVESLVVSALAAGLDVAGLMAVGAAGDPAATRAVFRTVADLADDLELEERSMGMSDDLESAVEHGSTMVRIGRALFGERATGEVT
jgi:hypothetical protein